MARGWRPGVDPGKAARHWDSEALEAAGVDGPPVGIFHTQARWTYWGTAPSAAVKNPDA
jgi:hypothetical protein